MCIIKLLKNIIPNNEFFIICHHLKNAILHHKYYFNYNIMAAEILKYIYVLLSVQKLQKKNVFNFESNL